MAQLAPQECKYSPGAAARDTFAVCMCDLAAIHMSLHEEYDCVRGTVVWM